MYWFVWMGNPGLWCYHLSLFLDLKLCRPCILVLKVQLCLPLYWFHSLMESSLWKKASIYSYYFQKILITTYICPPYTVWHTRISHDGHRRCNTVGVHVPKFKVKKWTSTPIPTHWTHDIRVKGIFLSGGKKSIFASRTGISWTDNYKPTLGNMNMLAIVSSECSIMSDGYALSTVAEWTGRIQRLCVYSNYSGKKLCWRWTL